MNSSITNRGKRKVASLIFILFIYAIAWIVYYILYFVYNIIFTQGQTAILTSVSALNSGTGYSVFLGGMLTFCSILFGFYSIILIETISEINKVFVIRIKERQNIAHILIAAAFIFLTFVPFFYLFFSIANSLIGLGRVGSLSSSANGLVLQNSGIQAAAITSTEQALSATWFIFITILIYAMMELQIIEYLFKKADEYLVQKQHF